MKEMGIETTFVPPTATLEELRAAMRPNTRAVFAAVSYTHLDVYKRQAHTCR